jgi:hypothetical protein
MNDPRKLRCAECGEEPRGLTRREFVQGVSAAAVAATGAISLSATARAAIAAAPKLPGSPETAVKRLYESMNDEQRKIICMPWEHELRQKYGANWAITKPNVAEFFTAEQRETIREIFRGVTSEEGYERFLKQMGEDYGGFDKYHVAIFGRPGQSEKFEWVMSGRHLTIRCDGNFEDGTAFGGPIVYGHGAGDSEPGLPGNVFYYQTQRVNEVFAMLDGKQRDKALLDRAPAESAVQIRPAGAPLPGIPASELTTDQKELVQKVMHQLLAPYREADVKEALGCVTSGGGLERVHLAFYKQGDIGSDGVWDIWRLESPSFVWHFRGSPHVHAYINFAHPTG